MGMDRVGVAQLGCAAFEKRRNTASSRIAALPSFVNTVPESTDRHLPRPFPATWVVHAINDLIMALIHGDAVDRRFIGPGMEARFLAMQ